MRKKADAMDIKQIPTKKSNIPAEYREILIGNKELDEKYGDIDLSVVIYGGISPSQNVISFIKLPARMQMFS